MKKYWLLLGISLLFLAWCGNEQATTPITVDEYQINYQGKIALQEQALTSENDFETRAIYVESGENISFRDSLIIEERYNQWKKVVVFSQEAIATLEDQGLIIEDKKEETIIINCKGKQNSSRIVSYTISSGFIAEVPKLYTVALFTEKNTNTIIIRSYITEQAEEQKQFLNALKSIQCL